MEHLHIRICEKDQTESAFPEYEGKPTADGTLAGVAILEGATVRGKAAVGLVIELTDGTMVRVTVTANNFYMAAMALKGACQRWGQQL